MMRAYARTSYTTSYDDGEKDNLWVPMSMVLRLAALSEPGAPQISLVVWNVLAL